MNVAVYGRVSDPTQLEGHSLDTQADRVDKFAESWFGAGMYELREYMEEGLSGDYPHEQFKDEYALKTRSALTRLIEDVERGAIDFVFFYRVDRLARDRGIFYDVEKRLQRKGVPYRFLDVNVDPTTDEGSMMIGVHQLFAELWLKQHKKRIKDAFAKRREEGYPPGGLPPYGLKWEDPETLKRGERRGWVRDPETCQWAIWMKERYLAGWTTTQIAEELVKLGVPRPARRGSNWDSGRVRTILVNHFYAGLIKHPDDSTTQGQHWEERLWDPAEWELMSARLKRNKRLGSTTVKSTHFPLGGIITCGHCGQRLYGSVSAATGKRLYQCRTRSRRGKDLCKGVGRLAEPIEKGVLGIIRQLALAGDVQDAACSTVASVLGKEQNHLIAHRKELDQELQSVQQRIDRSFDMRADGELTPAQYAEQNQRLSARRSELEQQMGGLDAELADQSSRTFELQRAKETLRNFEAVWGELDPAEQQEALHVVIEHATLERAEGEDLNLRVKVAFLPERIIPIPSYIKRKATSGPESLTPRELAYLKHKQTGLSDRAIANIFDTTVENAGGQWRGIRGRLGVETLEEALTLTADRLEREAHALPLSGRANKSPKHRPKIKWTEKLKAIVQALADNKPRKQIMAELGIKEKNLSERTRRMKRAIEVETTEELVAYARETGAIAD